MSLADIVNVTVITGSRTITQKGFGLGLVLGYNTVFDSGELYRKYSDASDMLTDGFEADHPQYQAVLKVFSQNPRPNHVLVGQHAAPNSKIVLRVLGAVAEGDVFTVKFKLFPDPTLLGTEYTASVTADGDDVAADIVDKLETALHAITGVSATSDATTCTFDADAAEVMIAVTSITSNLDARDETADPGVATAMANLDDALPDADMFYGVTTQYMSEPIITAMAAAIEAQERIFFAASGDSDIEQDVDTDVFSELQSEAYVRTFPVYSYRDNASFAGAAAMGAILARIPGSYTAKFKVLSGISATKLTATLKSRVKGKGANVYINVAGANIIEEGIVPGNEFLDVIIFRDWLVARIREACFFALVNNEKIAYTDAGAGIFEGIIRQQLRIGQQNGGLADDPAPNVVVPLVADIPEITRATRHLPDVKFTGRLAGAIHTLDIAGRLTS